MNSTPRSLGCALTVDQLDDRRAAWMRLEPAIVDRTPTEGGFRIRFRPGAAAGEVLRNLVAGERQCCGWASWAVTETEGSWVLDVTGPADRIAPLASAFGVAAS